MIIYRAVNKINGKSYVGRTIQSFAQRKSEHKYMALKNQSQFIFHKAIRKYGWKNFEWQMLEECSGRIQMRFRERFYITLYDSIKNGYNVRKRAILG